jgi:acetyl esterase/lipase
MYLPSRQIGRSRFRPSASALPGLAVNGLALNCKYMTVAYETVEGRDVLADVFQPTNANGPAPIVVAIRGGGWSNGACGDYLGGKRDAVADRYASASPVSYTKTGRALPPTLLMTGGRDQLVHVEQMLMLGSYSRNGWYIRADSRNPLWSDALTYHLKAGASQPTHGILLRFLREALSADR